ncbi:MAG: phage tail tape measure protein [Betaproteobacteria bacterium]|nr:phage tail tape measure protein [Betaproteobacteria bacterium]
MAFATLLVDFVARMASFEESMTRAGKSVANLENRFVSMGRTVSSALAGLGAGIGVGGLAAIAKSGIDAADSLNDMSQRLGVSVKDLASFRLAADQSGTSLDSVGAGIARLSRSIGEAEGGNKQLAQALQSLGITARDPKEALFQLADAVQKIEDPSKRAALLSQVLGKSYGELLPLLSQGSDALRESARQSETFAEAMSRLAPDADKFNDQLALMKINAAGLASELLVKLVPALNDILERMGLVKNLIASGGLFNTIAITAGTSEISEVMRRLKDDIKNTQAAIEGERAKGKDASPFEEKLRGLNAQLEVLKKNSRDAALALGEQFKNYKVPQIPGKPGRIDLSAASGKRNIDTESMSADDIANAWKQADDELKQYADDRAFVSKFDMQRDNAINAIAQEWKDAGEALKQDMLTPLEKFNNRLEYINELWQRGVIDIETYDRAMVDAFDKAAPKVDKLSDTARQLGLTFSSAFEDAIIGGKKFSEVLHGLAQDILRIIVRKKLTEPLANSVGNFADSFGLFGSANGNVFSNAPALSAYSGSVVSSPTLFPFANGIGLMGEAGPEAILPLKRGPGGKLGVAMDGGGGVVVQNYYTIDARGADAGVEQRIRRAIAESEDRAVDRSVGQVQNLNQRGLLRLS